MVTLICSSLKASSSGGGRKSQITLTSPIGSLVYLILLFIYPLSFTPVPGPKDPNYSSTHGEAHGQNAAANDAKAEVPFLILTVIQVFGYDAIGIGEGILSDFEWHIMFLPILLVLHQVPFEAHPIHEGSVTKKITKSNNNLWLEILLRHSGRRGGATVSAFRPLSLANRSLRPSGPQAVTDSEGCTSGITVATGGGK